MKNIMLNELKWEYPFMPRNNSYDYRIENDLIIVSRYNDARSQCWDIYETKLDPSDYDLKE